MVVAQLTEWSLPTLAGPGLNPLTGDFHWIFYAVFSAHKKSGNRCKKRPGMAIFFVKKTWIKGWKMEQQRSLLSRIPEIQKFLNRSFSTRNTFANGFNKMLTGTITSLQGQVYKCGSKSASLFRCAPGARWQQPSNWLIEAPKSTTKRKFFHEWV